MARTIDDFDPIESLDGRRGYVCEMCEADRPAHYRLADDTCLCKAHTWDVWRGREY